MAQKASTKKGPPPQLVTAKGDAKNVAVEGSSPPSGSPIGWTFYSSWLRCNRLWFLRYVLQMYPRETPWELIVGTVYHALLDGRTEAEIRSWGANYEKALPLAKKLHAERMKGPKFGKLVSSEETLEVKEGLLQKRYTSKPDRIEVNEEAPSAFGAKKAQVEDAPRIVREFKTAATLRDSDDKRWNVDGEVIGELVTSGLDTAVVDIITKFERPIVRQIEVKLTEKKKHAWEQLVANIIDDVRARLGKLLAGLTVGEPAPLFLEDMPALDNAFPRRLTECVSFSGRVCDYYDLCWNEQAATARGNFIKKNSDKPWAKRLLVASLVEDILKSDVRSKK